MTTAEQAFNITPFVLAAARHGWHVFPLRPGEKRPASAFRDWERYATTHPDRIQAFWSGAGSTTASRAALRDWS